MKKNYSISLDKEVVDEVREIVEADGYKLSPVINLLLKEWIKLNRKEDKE